MALPQRVPRRRNRGRNLQAAARILPDDNKRYETAEPLPTGGFGWQNRAWHVYRHLGAIHYAMSFIRDNVALIDYYVAEKSDDPEAEAEPLDLDHPAAVELERLGNGPYGGVSDLFAELVVHNKVAGEGRLSVRYERDGEPIAAPSAGDPPADAEEVWEVLTAQTLAKRRRDPKFKPAESVRIWKPDPEKPDHPDSSLRAVLTECEQLLLIQQMTTGTLQSRLHNGILAIAEELDPTPPAPPDEGDDEMGPLMRDIFTALSSPIAEPNAAAAIMPYLLMGKSEWLDKLKHITLDRDFDAQILEIKHDLLATVAGGIDLPAERLIGMAESGSHWNLWYIGESEYAQHIKPSVELVVGGVIHGWLRPAWQAANLDPEDFDIFIDTTPLTSKVLKSADAIQAYKLGEMSGEALRRHLGFDASDAPTDDDPGLRGQVRSVDVDVPAGQDTVEPGPPGASVQAAATIEDLGARLADIDADVLADLETIVGQAVDQEAEAAEERLLEAMAAAGISVDTEPLAEALAEANISPAEIVADDAFENVVEPAAARMADAIAEAGDAIEAATGTSVTPSGNEVANIAGAAAGLAVGLTEWLRSRWFSDKPGPDDNAARFARHGADLRPPGGLLLDSMTEAGGGLGGSPGARGVANGQTVEVWLLESGLAIQGYRWRHGGPAEPFPPHRRLDGVEFTGRDDPKIANTLNSWPHNEAWLPGDHRFCTCSWQKILMPAAEANTL